jgi:hypothetical protein
LAISPPGVMVALVRRCSVPAAEVSADLRVSRPAAKLSIVM